MNESLPNQLVLVSILAFCGIGLALIGTTTGLGVESPEANTEQIMINENTVTISDGDTEVVVIEDLSMVTTVEMTAHRGHVAIETEEPFSDEERSRAIEIVRSNESINKAIDMEAYDFTAEPIENRSAEQSSTVDFTVEDDSLLNDDESGTNEDATLTVRIDEDKRNNTVTAERDIEYMEGVLHVKIIDPETDERRFSARVDLENETIVTLDRLDKEGFTNLS